MGAPFVLKLKNKSCLVIGGGKIAERKISYLISEGAQVTVISPELTPGLRHKAGTFSFISGKVGEHDVTEETAGRFNINWRTFFLVVAATGCKSVNRLIGSRLAQFIPLINVVDDQELCTFFFPAVLERGLLKIAVSTSGASPHLAKKIKERLAVEFGPEYEHYVNDLARFRQQLQNDEPDMEQRKKQLKNRALFPVPDSYKTQYDPDGRE